MNERGEARKSIIMEGWKVKKGKQVRKMKIQSLHSQCIFNSTSFQLHNESDIKTSSIKKYFLNTFQRAKVWLKRERFCEVTTFLT